MISVVFILAATLTLLPAVLGKLGPTVDNARAAVGALGRAPLAAVRRLGRAAVAAPVRLRLARADRARRADRPGVRPEDRHAVDQGRARARTARASATTRSSRPSATGAPGALQIVSAQARRRARDRRSPRPTRASPQVMPADAGRRRHGARAGRAQAAIRPSPATGATIDRLRSALPAGALVGGVGRREPRPRDAAVGQDAARHRRRPGPRVPAAAGRAAGADHRRARRADEPAGDRRGVRRRAADLPGGPRQRPARLRAAGLPRRLGTGVLLRDDLRDLDGLHGVPAVARAKEHWDRTPRRRGGDGRRRRAQRPRDLRRRRR